MYFRTSISFFDIIFSGNFKKRAFPKTHCPLFTNLSLSHLTKSIKSIKYIFCDFKNSHKSPNNFCFLYNSTNSTSTSNPKHFLSVFFAPKRTS